jgi:exo-beta-1,3-glucanase (GH17 family)
MSSSPSTTRPQPQLLLLSVLVLKLATSLASAQNSGKPWEELTNQMPKAGIPFDTDPVAGLSGTTNVEITGAYGSHENGYHIYGVTYSAFGLGDNRLCPPFDDVGGMCLLPTQVALDIQAISKLTSRVRTYSSVCTAATWQILASARKAGMTVMFGVWLQADSTSNANEFARAMLFVKEFQDVISDVIVGNEPVYSLGLSASFVAEKVREFRGMMNAAGVNKPVGVGDIYSIWMGENVKPVDGTQLSSDIDMTSVIEAADWVGVNTHVYWAGLDPTTGDAAGFLMGQAQAVAKRTGKPVKISETGFATAGDTYTGGLGTAVPGEGQLTAFLSDVELAAREAGQAVFFFESFNGDWKRRWTPFVEMDYSFGFAYCNRTTKGIHFPPLGAV